jgi:hypothetical protein
MQIGQYATSTVQLLYFLLHGGTGNSFDVYEDISFL